MWTWWPFDLVATYCIDFKLKCPPADIAVVRPSGFRMRLLF